MIDFNLEYYRAFYYVARLGSITKAAEALFLSQPAITRSIQKLETQMTCQLFLRSPKGVRLTREGDVLFTHVAKAFELMITGENELKRLAQYDVGKLEIAATETALYHFLLPKIEAFRTCYPNIYIHVTGSNTPENLQMLRNGVADLAVAVTPIDDRYDLEVTHIRDFQDIFIAGMAYKHLKGKCLTLKEIFEYPIVTVEKNTSSYKQLNRWFEENGILFEPDYSVRTSTTVLPFVERNLAIGVIPSLFAEELIYANRIFQLQTEKKIPHRTIAIVCNKIITMSALCKRFFDFLLQPL